jgi:hypothetical protein
MANNAIEFIGVLTGKGSDYHARLAHVTVFENVALPLQPMDCSTHGSAAQVQPLSQVGFYDPSAGRNFSMHYEFPNLLESR